jgi:methanogenic corrinoid protein MtbC1
MSDLYAELEKAIEAGDIDTGTSEALRLVESGHSPLSIFADCIEPCLTVIGDRFGRLEIFLPELMQAADVVKAVQSALLPYLQADQVQATKGRIVLGTAFGDLHDIGKNIVRAMLEVNGFEVHDLGVDIPVVDFINRAKDLDADIIAISALMLPSLPYVRDVIDLVKENEKTRDRFRILVGGGPVSAEWAQSARADGYGADAMEAVQEAQRLTGR